MFAEDIVQQAYREPNIVPLDPTTGIPVLTPGDLVEGLIILNRVILSLLSYEIGNFAGDWPVPPSRTSPVAARYPLLPANEDLPSDVWPYPPANVRIISALTSDTRVYLPSRPDDGAQIMFTNIADPDTYTLTVDGNGRYIAGAQTYTLSPGFASDLRLFYRADLSDWQVISPLIATDSSPLPAIYDDLLSMMTAFRLAPRHGRAISPETSAALSVALRRLKAQYKQKSSQPTANVQPFNSNARGTYRGSLIA